MGEALALARAPWRDCGVRVVVSLGLFLVAGGLAVAAADISISALQVGVVEIASGVDRSSLGLDGAVVGDTVRVSALVTNDGATATGEFEVDFFFTETISGEHGRLGTQVVSGLEPGESKRPVVVFDTSAFSPGIYVFSAEADPRDLLSDTDPCDNTAPRRACDGSAAESQTKYTLTIVREGRHISQLALSGAFPTCPMGNIGKNLRVLTVVVHNVGTQPLTSSDLAVYGYYRQGLNPPANDFVPLVTDGAGNPVQLTKIVSFPQGGRAGSISITLNYDTLAQIFAPPSALRESGEVLGRANAAQLRITVQTTDGSGASQDIFLPEQFELAQFYSSVELWTFPQRATCCSSGCTSVLSAPEVPAVAGGRVFHVARTAAGDVLYVLKIDTGEEKDSWSAPAGKTLSSPVAFFDEGTNAYRVFVAASDGRVYALEGVDKEDGDFLVDLWQSVAADQVAKGATHLRLSSDRAKLIVGSESGAFVLDAASGQTSRKITSHGGVTSAPAYNATTGDVWLAADEVLWRVPASGNECSYNVGERITTDLATNASGTAVFFGTESGFVYALNGSTCAVIADERPLRSVVGIAVASDGNDAVIFLTSDIGVMARAEYAHNRDFRSGDVTVSQSVVEPYAASDAPALLLNSRGDDAVAVFLSGEEREGRTYRPVLQACDRDLEELQTVPVWGGVSIPFIFKPKEGEKIPSALLRPVIDQEWATLLVASSDGYLYAFDLGDI